MRSRLCLTAVLFTMLGVVAAAQQPPEILTLDDCIRLAGAAPSTITLAQQETEIARRGVTSARAGFLPQAHLANNFTYNSPLLHDRSQFSFVALNGIREYSFAFTAVQQFDTSGKLRAGMALARANQEAAAGKLALARRELKRTVTAAYYRLLLTRHVAKVVETTLREGEEFEHRTKLLFENGEAARADLVQASTQVAFLRQSLQEAQLAARLANQDLASFWTRDVDKRLNVEDVLNIKPAPPGEEASPQPGEPFLRRLEFNLLDAQRRMLEAEARGAKSAMLPQLSAVFQYGIDSNAVLIHDRGYAAFVSLDIPIFDWLKAHNDSKQFRLRARQITTNRAITERAFSREYANALARVKDMYRQIEITSSQVELAKENLRLSRIRYEGGEGSMLAVVTAQNRQAQAQTNYYTAVASYLNARVDLEVAAGR